MTVVHPRSDWTARKPKGTTALVASAVKWIAVHWPGSSGSLAKKDVRALLRGWQGYHMDSRGWRDIAYNEAVDLTGEAWTLRGNVADGSVANLGGQVYSILAVLGTSDTPTDAMLATLAERIAVARKRYPNAKVVGHRDLKSTDCPGSKLAAWLKAGMPLDTPKDTPVVIVAGSANTDEDKLHAKYRRRLDVALALLDANPALKVVVTGGAKASGRKTEAANAKEYLVEHGIAAARIVEEGRSGSTAGNFTYGLPLASAVGATSVIVVSDLSHGRRCLALCYAANAKLKLGLTIDGARWYADSKTQDATVAQAVEQARAVWSEMTAGIVEELDAQFGVTAKPAPKPSSGPAFPLPSGYYFGPKLPTTNAHSVSGYYGRKFGGKTDREWLKVWQTQAAKLGAYKGQIDGLYGPLTAAAAKTIQQRAKLAVDGLIGAKTWPATWSL